MFTTSVSPSSVCVVLSAKVLSFNIVESQEITSVLLKLQVINEPSSDLEVLYYAIK